MTALAYYCKIKKILKKIEPDLRLKVLQGRRSISNSPAPINFMTLLELLPVSDSVMSVAPEGHTTDDFRDV